MAQVYERKKGDVKTISNHLIEFENFSDKLLIDLYNRMVKVGLFDVHSQKLYVLALRVEFLKRFDKTPIIFEDNIILRLSEEIEFVE